MRILLVSTTAEKARLASNLVHHCEMLALAAEKRCDVAVFPEFSLTGSVDAVRHRERAVTVRDDAIAEIVAATGSVGVAAVFGIGERDGANLYITQLFAAAGELRGRYRKRHLGEDEIGFALGVEPGVFELGGTRFGIVICAEAGAEFTWADIASAGASVVFFCAAPGLYGRRNDEEGWRAGLSWWEECGLGDAVRAAREHHLWVALVTQAGSTVDEDFPGLAALVDPSGEVVSRTPDWRPATLVVETAAEETLRDRDVWFEWLTSRRPGGSGDRRRALLDRLAPVRDAVLDHARIEPGDTVLDVGAGDGLVAFAALERVGPTGLVILSDVSAVLLEHSSRLARELAIPGGVRFVQARAEDLSPIGDSSVDVVTMRSVLIYVADKQAAFREFYRVLRPGGRVSLYEQINALMREPGRLCSYDVSGVAQVFAKIEAVYDSIQDPKTCPMLDFDEQDLLVFAERAGLEEVHLELYVDIEPEGEPVPWETFVNSAGNPLVPTWREAMDEVLTAAEATEFEAHLRPLVEQGVGRRRMAGVYLWATKSA